MKERGWDLTKLRQALVSKSGDEVRPGVVDHWVYGDGRPSVHYAAQLETLLGVPAVSWAQPVTEPFSLPEAA